MSKWANWHRYGLDLETTSTDALTGRIVQAAWVEIPREGRPRTRTWLVDPGVEIPDEAAAVHGITTAHAQAEGMEPGQMLFELVGLVALALGHGHPVVIYNASYDATMLEAECHRHGIDGLVARLGAGRVQPIVDPMVIARRADKFRIRSVKDEHGEPIRLDDGTTKKYCYRCDCGATDWTLASTCLHYKVPLLGAHGAAADARAAARLWPAIMARHPRSFPGMTIGSLHQAQVGWKKEQADGLRDFFNKVGVDDHDECPDPHDHQCCDTGWPFQTDLRRALAVAS